MILHHPPTSAELPTLADPLYTEVFRTDFDHLGFALIGFAFSISSLDLRRFMGQLKESLSQIHYRQTGKHLVYLSMLRFDQQVTTRFHLDGGPAESYLMLGYEPSDVKSELAIADYARAAHYLGITTEQFLADYNPLSGAGAERLDSHIARLSEFDPMRAQILLVNNSHVPRDPRSGNPLGVMHQATISTPQPDKSRVINSIMLGAATDLAEEPVSSEAQQEYLYTALL